MLNHSTLLQVQPDCSDNPYFANCKLIVKARYCGNKYYAKFCCRSCTLAGQKIQIGSEKKVCFCQGSFFLLTKIKTIKLVKVKVGIMYTTLSVLSVRLWVQKYLFFVVSSLCDCSRFITVFQDKNFILVFL